jgi:adenylate cyclase
MMEQHYCAHPLIPGYSAPTPAGIKEWAVKEIYTFCVENDLREAWAYLWENWYQKGRWELWARSVYEEIAVLKMTMILESQ